MQILRHPLFILSATLFAAHQLLEHEGLSPAWANNYLDDLLVMPVLLSLALAFQRRFVWRNPSYRFAPWHVLFALGHIAFTFEWLLPRFSDRYTGDPADVLCYAAGAAVFYIFLVAEKPKKEELPG